MTRQVTLVVVGAGHRGNIYADLAATYGRARVVAVVEPDHERREAFADAHDIPATHRFGDWAELAGQPPLADAVVIATQDAMHYEPAMAFIKRGYHILLEKPMASTQQECEAIVETAEAAGVTMAVCHVLRYTPYSMSLQRLVKSGAIGDVVSVEHLEPVGWWHHAHSYVRGNWRREDQASFMLMTKSVHDIDWLNHVVDGRPERVSSFGGLYHFRPEQRPEGAGDRCLDCTVEPDCPYSAPKIYLSCLGDPAAERWPLATVTTARTPEGVIDALRDGPYGRCVYACDNDVVDHQVVTIEYAGGVTASFTMTAFTEHEFRKTRVFGTHGCIEGDGHAIELLDFRTRERHQVDVPDHAGPSLTGGHGGGDFGLVQAFVRAVASGNPREHLPDPRESLAAHQLTWAAERARVTSSVVDVSNTASPA